MSPIRLTLFFVCLFCVAACGSAPASTPVALAPSASPPLAATPTASPLPATLTPSPVPASPTAAPAPATPTPSALPPTPTIVPPSGEGLLAWTVADDGAVFVLEPEGTLMELSPDDLSPLARSAPLFGPAEAAPAHLAAGERQLFVSSDAISKTLVLDRDGLGLVGELEGFGPLAVGPDGRLFMIPQYLEELWPFGNFEIWVYDLADLDAAPVKVRRTGMTMELLVIDADSRRLIVLQSSVAASPPHQGQSYAVLDLDTLAELDDWPWERGSLSRPAIHPHTAEVLASRIGLNWTRRFLGFDQDGEEVRSLDSVDGQPAIDPVTGEWIYLLRRQGLWLLRDQDLSVQGILPFSGPPPRDLALSPDGQTLYLFGNGWLEALSTAELQSRGLASFGPLPTAWFSTRQNQELLQARVYPSPHIDRDGFAYLQMVSGFSVLETYQTSDGGQTWTLLPTLLRRDLVGEPYLSLSPNFSQDRTLAAVKGTLVLRSSDGGETWQPWQPRIAFSSDRDGNREIYTADLQGQDVQRVTRSPAAEENPAWSPAWTYLAYQSDRSGNWDILTTRTDCDADAEAGCDLRQLTSDPGDDMLPAWSPDGRSIAFVSTRDGNPEIYVMDTEGGNQRRLTFDPGGDWRPVWHTDSRQLFFVSGRSGNNDIYQMAVPPSDGVAPSSEPEITPVIVGPADDRDPAVRIDYVPRMIFLSDRDGFMRTYSYDYSSSPMLATEPDQPEAHPATLTGEPYLILVSSEREGSTDIYRAAAYSAYESLIASPGFDGQPAAEAVGWRPDFEASLAWLEQHK